MHIQETKMTIVVMSCDEYKDVPLIAGMFKNKYWKDCPYQVYLITHEGRINYDEYYDKVIRCPINLTWMERLDSVIDEIQTEYILLMCDDFFPYKEVKSIDYDTIMDDMQEEKVGLTKIYPRGIKGFSKKINSKYSECLPGTPFRIGYCVGLWKKSYLKRFSPCGHNAWKAEYENTLDSSQYTDRVFQLDKIDKNAFLHAVMSGCWNRDAYSQMRKENIPKEILDRRKKKNMRLYIKDMAFNVGIKVAPKLMIDIQERLKIGRGK